MDINKNVAENQETVGTMRAISRLAGTIADNMARTQGLKQEDAKEIAQLFGEYVCSTLSGKAEAPAGRSGLLS